MHDYILNVNIKVNQTCQTHKILMDHDTIFVLFFLQRKVSVGPESVAFRFTSEALCFGGEQCTLTDVAMAAGVAPASIGHSPDGVKSIASDVVYSAMREIRRKLENAIDSMKVTRF